jgi:MSHA biogenesis protein MshP
MTHATRRGIALPAVIFLLVIVGLMLSAGLLMLTQSQHGQSLQLQASRALAAAKSGTEWGLYQVSDVNGAQGLPADALPNCFAAQTLTLPAPLADLPVQLSCTREPASGTLDEGGLKLVSYRILAQVAVGTAADNDFVQRQFEARHTVCRNPGGNAPRYAC